MSSGDPPVHLLSLKVMRLSRPDLASAWQPFYSSSPSFSAHSSASIVSLQGTKPLPTHPKTLRDLTHVSELLTLPASFGAIQLGETFSGCLCVNNETQAPVKVVQFRVEMQTATNKIVLCEVENEDEDVPGENSGDAGATATPKQLRPGTSRSGVLVGGDTLERVVSHEIKELGQHVLACTVSYRLPNGFRPVPGSVEDAEDPTMITFRKFYKFAVTNPLSVKTKIHSAKSPSAMLYPQEREKTFLEVHIQNLTQNAIYFERMRLECTEAWDAIDVNVFQDEETGEQKSIFSDSMALMQPQDTRQYVYILTPKHIDTLPPNYALGSSIPLGRLDISWRSSFGEPGRLLTSMLSRRIPLPPAQQPPAPALPPHLKRTIASEPPRPHSPLHQHHQSLSRPGTPPASGHRPTTGSVSAGFSHSPLPPSAALPLPTPLPELEATITARSVLMSTVKVNESFKLALKLTLSTNVTLQHEGSTRRVVVVIQTLRARDIPLPLPVPQVLVATAAQQPEAFSPRLPSSGFSTPSSAPGGFNYALAHQKILAASTKPLPAHEPEDPHATTSRASILPPPYYNDEENSKVGVTAIGSVPPSSKRTDGIIFIGPSSINLSPIEIRLSQSEAASSSAHESQDFELTCVAVRQGFHTIGGLRVLVVEDGLSEGAVVGDEVPHPLGIDTSKPQASRLRRAMMLKEIGVLGEVWVSS